MGPYISLRQEITKKKFFGPISELAVQKGDRRSKKRPKISFFQISWKLIKNFIFLTTYSRKLIKFLKFKKKIHQNRINGLDFRAAGSSKSVSRVQKSRLKSSKNGKNIDFFEKILTVTDIFFDFMGGYRLTFSRKIGQNRSKTRFLV